MGGVTTLTSRIMLLANGVEYESGLRVRGTLKVYNAGIIRFGYNVTINSGLWANPISASGKTCIQVSEDAILKIGNGTGLSNTAITCQKEILIGNNVMIGANCQIFDTDFHPLESFYRYENERSDDFVKRETVVIEDGVFIGSGVIILKGTHIGKKSIIGAGSVVSGNVPSHEIWAGTPAIFIKQAE